MSMLEVINEIKKNLEDMREVKKGIKTALENKFGKDVGDDFTKYPKKIDEVWSEHEKIKVGESAYHLFSHQIMFRPIWDFSSTTNFNEMLYLASPPDDELEQKIEIDIRNASNYNRMMMLNKSINQYDFRKHFKIIGLPRTTDNLTSILGSMFSYLDNMKCKDDIFILDEEKDLKGRVFSANWLWEYSDINIDHLPNWFVQIFPYLGNFENLEYNISDNKKFILTEDVELELCKEQDITNSRGGCFFLYLDAPNIHISCNNNFYSKCEYSLFDNGKCDGVVRIDGPGCLIFTNRYTNNGAINKIAKNNFKGNRLEIKFKVDCNLDQDFSNFKDVLFLDGTEFYSVSNLPYKTQEEWVSFFDTLPDNSESNFQNIIKISSDYYNLLTEDNILIATDKGYTIQSV